MLQRERDRNGDLRGSQIGTSLLTEAAVLDIRKRWRRGDRWHRPTMTEVLAKEHGVTQATILQIVQGRSWKHVTVADEKSHTGDGVTFSVERK